MRSILNKTLLSAMAVLFSLHLKAQDDFAGTQSLQSAIGFLQKKFGVIFSYDVELTNNVPVKIDSSAKELKKIIQDLNSRTAFSFEIINDKTVIVKPKQPGINFIISGFVFDEKTREPLLGTMIYEKKGRYGTYANEDGSFHKGTVYNSEDTIVVSCIGYEKIYLSTGFFYNGPKKILLQSQRIQMNEVAVTAYLTTGITYDALDNSLNIRPRNISLLPGNTNGDVLSALDALPGISTPDGKAGNLNIRGSTPDQTQINVDNIPVYLRGHYFGTISPLNPNAVDNIKVQRSIMSVEKGGRAGGLIDIHLPVSVTNKMQTTIAASALDANIYSHIPVLKDKLSVVISGRHSYPYRLENPSLKPLSNNVFEATEVYPLINGTSQFKLEQLAFDYKDANARINFNLGGKHKGGISYLYIQNNMLLERSSQKDNLRQNDNIEMNNQGVNLNLQSDWSKKFNTYLSLTHSGYYQIFDSRKSNFKNDTTALISVFENFAFDSRFQFETSWHFAKNFVLKNGYDGRLQDLSYYRKTDNRTNTSFKTNFFNEGMIHSLYSTLAGNITKKFLINIGARANYYSVTGEYSFEPRVFMNYALSDNFRLKMSSGYQKQFVTQILGVSIESIGGLENQLWLLADDKTIPVINSLQGTFGAMYEKNSWLIDAEAYYRKVENISSISLTAPLSPKPFISGNIETKGVDLLLRKQWKNIDNWISYSISESFMRFDSINDGKKFYSLYDQTHVLDLGTSYRLRRWRFSLSWKYRTGLAALPGIRTKMLHGASSTPKAPSGPQAPSGGSNTLPLTQGLYNDRFPDYHQLDASVFYSFPREVKKYRGNIGVSVVNCYNQKNIIEQIPSGRSFINRTTVGLAPNAFVSFSF